MKIYLDKTNKTLSVFSNFEPDDITNLIEVSIEDYNTYMQKTSSGFSANVLIEDDKYSFDYKKKEYKKSPQIEIDEIQQWFIDNDWKVNKIVVGEWEKDDIRWIEYLKERNSKRERLDELNAIIGG